jgi:hypothetical protein
MLVEKISWKEMHRFKWNMNLIYIPIDMAISNLKLEIKSMYY